MVSSISTALGAGSGIDTKALIDSLAAAVREPREKQIAKREAANSASISALADISSAIDSFAAALSGLVSGGTLFSQPSVSDPTLLTAVAQPGVRLGALSAQVRVDQLAQSQTLVSTAVAGASAPVGQGTLTLTTAVGSFAVTIGAGNDSLDGLAKAINDAGSGVKASIVTEQGNARLVLKGATGEAQAFTLDVPGGTTSGLERFAFGPSVTGGMTSAQSAQDAIVTLDGVQVKRASNSIGDLIEGVQIDLKRADPGSTISIGIARPTAAISQAVNDFAAAYNELHSILASATSAPATPGGEGGALRGDVSVREMQRQLSRLSSAVLNSTGGPQTLAEIGVATNRDGTLSVNAARLQTALEADPDGVEKLFNPSQYSSSPFAAITSKMGKVKPGTYTLTDLVPASGPTPASGKINGILMIASGSMLVAPSNSPAVGLVVNVLGATASATITVDAGLGGALQAIRDSLRARSGPMAASQEKLRAEAADIADDRAAMETRSQTYYNQLVASFTTMERRVSAFKATQSYLDQQIKAWNSSND